MNISKSKQFTILRIQDLLNPNHICLEGPTIKLLCSTKTAIEPVRKADTGYIVVSETRVISAELMFLDPLSTSVIIKAFGRNVRLAGNGPCYG